MEGALGVVVPAGGNNGPRPMESLRPFCVCCILCPLAPFSIRSRISACANKPNQMKPNQTKRNEINPKPQNVKKDNGHKARSKFQLSTMLNIWSS